jgi:hypothetical protein
MGPIEAAAPAVPPEPASSHTTLEGPAAAGGHPPESTEPSRAMDDDSALGQSEEPELSGPGTQAVRLIRGGLAADTTNLGPDRP